METRLFWIGVAMGIYVWLSRRWIKSGKLDTRLRTAAWHALFDGLAGFGITLILVLSIESRIRLVSVSPGTMSIRELLISLGGALLAAGWGFWRAWSQGKVKEKRDYYLNEDQEWGETIFSAVLLAALLMFFVVQAFKIPSGSMESTLLVGDHLFVNKFIYGVRIPFTDARLFRFRRIKRGDIIVFRFPTDDKDEVHCGTPQYGKDFIKRVVGLPGEMIEIRKGFVHVDGEPLGREEYAQYRDPYRRDPPATSLSEEQYQELWTTGELDAKLGDTMKDNFGPVKVPEKAYFVMGDNRDRSCDGRFWGPVDERYLKGKAWVIYWPPSRMGGMS
ncbi:signal peptidase I [Elusimicrobiota bacterium]